MEFIVAEISKNWPGKRDGPIIAALFEEVINHNAKRGYRLHSYQINRLLTGPTEMNETIIAVFQKEE